METKLHFVPALVGKLGFRVELPADWQQVAIPREEVDFNQPAAFLPLMLAMPPYAAVAFTVAARPAYQESSLSVWVSYLLNEQQIDANEIEPGRIGPFHGIVGRAVQQQDDMTVDFRFAFFEDGGRLVQLGMTGPAAIASVGKPAWEIALTTFALETPMGQEVPVLGVTGKNKPADVEESGPPEWWMVAMALERQNRLEEAEAMIRQCASHSGGMSMAELYRQRMHRLRSEGDAAGASAAREQAVQYAYAYASHATSGGEGEARSYERDAFIGTLDTRPEAL